MKTGLKRRPVVRTRGVRRPRLSYRSGRDTRDAIATAAESVLVQYGYANFTLKRVADAVGIAVGNLTYHFPTKEALVETLIERTLGEYARRFSTLMDDPVDSPDELLGNLLDWVIDDSTSERYSRLFRELWSMAMHSSSVAHAMDQFYDRSIEDVVRRLRPRFQASARRELRLLITLVCVVSEGASVLFGARRSHAGTLRGIKRLARSAIGHLAQTMPTPR